MCQIGLQGDLACDSYILPHYNRSQAYPLGNYMYIRTPGKDVQFGITANASANITLNNIILKSHAIVYVDVGIIVLSIITRCERYLKKKKIGLISSSVDTLYAIMPAF